MAQQMCYLMDRSSIPVENYGFFWDIFGPYSETLQNRLAECIKILSQLTYFTMNTRKTMVCCSMMILAEAIDFSL